MLLSSLRFFAMFRPRYLSSLSAARPLLRFSQAPHGKSPQSRPSRIMPLHARSAALLQSESPQFSDRPPWRQNPPSCAPHSSVARRARAPRRPCRRPSLSSTRRNGRKWSKSGARTPLRRSPWFRRAVREFLPLRDRPPPPSPPVPCGERKRGLGTPSRCLTAPKPPSPHRRPSPQELWPRRR